MYEEKRLTVGELRTMIDGLGDDIVVAGGCCLGSSTAHVVNRVEFDSSFGDHEHIVIEAGRLARADDGTLLLLLNTDDDYIGLDREYMDEDEEAQA